MTFIDVRRRSFLSGEIMNAAQIRQLAAAALRGKTDAEDRIYLTEAWPITTYPAILLQTPLEVKESIGRNAPQFKTITTLRISGHIQLSEGENPVTVAASALERLCEQIQRAVINSYELTARSSNSPRCVPRWAFIPPWVVILQHVVPLPAANPL